MQRTFNDRWASGSLGRWCFASSAIGEVSLSDDGVTGYAKIFFKGETKTSLDLNGEFYLVAAGSPDRLWLVSSRETLPPTAGAVSGTPADELVSLEAVRFP